MFKGGSVLSSSAVSAGLYRTFFFSSALCSSLEIKSDNVSPEDANFPLQTPLQTPDLHGFLQSESSARVVNSSSKETFVTHSSAVCSGCYFTESRLLSRLIIS